MVSLLSDLLKAHVVPVGQRLIKNKLPKIKTTDNEKKHVHSQRGKSKRNTHKTKKIYNTLTSYCTKEIKNKR